MAKKNETKEEIKRIEKKPVRTKKEPLFYMGPTIKTGILEKGAIFRGKIPNIVTELIKTNPTVKALIVPKKDYVSACKDMRVKGSRMQILYKRASKGGK